MEHCKAIIIAACMLSLTVGLCNALKPGLIFEKQIRFLISVIFVLGLASPILRLRQDGICMTFSQNVNRLQTQELTEKVYESILETTTVQTESALHDLLSKNGIICTQLTVHVHIDEGQRIYISEVSAECDQPEATCEILRASLGEEVILHVSKMD